MIALRVLGLWLLGWVLVAVGLSAPALAGERVITIAQYADLFISLDPQHTMDNASYSIQKPMLEGLIGFNEKMEQIPQLAERWDASPDARVYTFHLRKGVKFHDGTPFNAAAVKANFDRVRNPDNKLLRYTLYKIISQIDVLDDSTVRFTLSEPFGAMIATFAHPAGAISSPTAVQKYGKDYGTNPVGTGPYKFAEWVPSAHITLVKNPDYWDKANDAKVDKIIIKPVPEDGTRIAMLQKGEAQFINPVPHSMAEVVQKDKNLSLVESESVYTSWVAMNVQKKPFTDVRVRQALNYAIDKEAIIKTLLRGHGKLADSPLAPQVWGYSPVKMYPYDPAKAKALLAEAGYPNGLPNKVLLRGVAQTGRKEVMVALQGQLKQVGVDVEVLALPQAALRERLAPLAENRGEMDFAGFSPSTGDADWGIRPLLTKDNWPPTNYTIGFYTNPKVEEAIQAGLQTADPAKRKAAYAEAQRVIMDDCPWIFLWVEYLLGGSRANVGGISIQPDGIGFYRSVYYK
jgi:glutathione transport system substrate-binding protein